MHLHVVLVVCTNSIKTHKNVADTYLLFSQPTYLKSHYRCSTAFTNVA